MCVSIRDALRREFISKDAVNERKESENTLVSIFDGIFYQIAIIFTENCVICAIIYSDRFEYIISLNSKVFTRMSKNMAFRPYTLIALLTIVLPLFISISPALLH